MRRLAQARRDRRPRRSSRSSRSSSLGIVVGGRLFHVLTHLDDFKGRWIDVIRIDKGGMVMYGGLIAVFVWQGPLVPASRKLPVLRVADVGAIAGALGLGIGRIGCILAGCDYGKPVDPSFPLAIRFPSATRVRELLRPDGSAEQHPPRSRRPLGAPDAGLPVVVRLPDRALPLLALEAPPVPGPGLRGVPVPEAGLPVRDRVLPRRRRPRLLPARPARRVVAGAESSGSSSPTSRVVLWIVLGRRARKAAASAA